MTRIRRQHERCRGHFIQSSPSGTALSKPPPSTCSSRCPSTMLVGLGIVVLSIDEATTGPASCASLSANAPNRLFLPPDRLLPPAAPARQNRTVARKSAAKAAHVKPYEYRPRDAERPDALKAFRACTVQALYLDLLLAFNGLCQISCRGRSIASKSSSRQQRKKKQMATHVMSAPAIACASIARAARMAAR